MILFLNGPFGVGKTSAFAKALVEKTPHSMHYDPEVVGLRKLDRDLSCFRLAASRYVLLDRISSDMEDREAYSWRSSHVEVCLEASGDPAFGTEIRTEVRTPAEIADEILERLATPSGWSRN